MSGAGERLVSEEMARYTPLFCRRSIRRALKIPKTHESLLLSRGSRARSEERVSTSFDPAP